MNPITSRLKLIKEGYSLRDKALLSIWAVLTASSLLVKQDGYKFLFRDVKLKTSEGIFLCRRGKADIKLFTGYDDSIGKQINLSEGVFIDIGAHIGKYTIKVGRMLKNSGRVVSIELMPDNFEVLKRNIGLNHLINVTPINVGCFSRNEELPVSIVDLSSSTGTNSITNKVGSKSINLPVKRLDDLIEEQKLERVDLIKIDVEGAEVEVLKGAMKTIKKFHPKIIFEINNHIQEIRSILFPLGYEINQITEGDAIAFKW